MKFFKYTVSLALGLLLIAGSVFAQGQRMQMQPANPDSVTDQELKKVATITTEAQKVRKQSQQKVDSMLQETDMDMRRFQQIMMSKRNPKMADSMNVTQQEQATIKELQPKLMKVQRQSQQQMMSIIQNEGMNPKRFQQVMQAVRTNPELMKRFKQLNAGSQN